MVTFVTGLSQISGNVQEKKHFLDDGPWDRLVKGCHYLYVCKSEKEVKKKEGSYAKQLLLLSQSSNYLGTSSVGYIQVLRSTSVNS